jgi:hypothetical protein
MGYITFGQGEIQSKLASNGNSPRWVFLDQVWFNFARNHLTYITGSTVLARFNWISPWPMHCRLSAYSLPIHCLLVAIHCLFTAYSLPIHCLCTAYSLPIHCLFTAYSLPIHCLFIAYSLMSLGLCTAYWAEEKEWLREKEWLKEWLSRGETMIERGGRVVERGRGSDWTHINTHQCKHLEHQSLSSSFTSALFLLPDFCYSLPIHCLFTAYSLPIHCLFTAYSLPIHCLFTDALNVCTACERHYSVSLRRAQWATLPWVREKFNQNLPQTATALDGCFWTRFDLILHEITLHI